jgi:membrane complex biogenesis BtpA family protein
MLPLIGVVHLAPLPGAPLHALPMNEIIDRAVADARAYQAGGASALIVENFGDVPYARGRVEPQIVAAMTMAVDRVMAVVDLPIGINVLRNDARAALGIAAVTGAAFVRVNVHTGVMATDQGIIEGRAHETLRYRALLHTRTQIWADVQVKHGAPLGETSIEDAAEDALQRGLADAVIVTGTTTGKAADQSDVIRLRERLPDAVILVGSGVSPETLPAFAGYASGFIVGTWAKEGGDIHRPVDASRVAEVARLIREAGYLVDLRRST